MTPKLRIENKREGLTKTKTMKNNKGGIRMLQSNFAQEIICSVVKSKGMFILLH